MKLLILSDTHRSLGFACEAIEKEAPDTVIHLGDHLGDAEDLRDTLIRLLKLHGKGERHG